MSFATEIFKKKYCRSHEKDINYVSGLCSVNFWDDAWDLWNILDFLRKLCLQRSGVQSLQCVSDPPSNASRLVQTRKAGVFWERSRPRRCSSHFDKSLQSTVFRVFQPPSWNYLASKVCISVVITALEMKEKLRTGHKAIKSIDKVFNEFPGC